MASPPSLSTVPDASLIASQRKLFLGGLSWVTTEGECGHARHAGARNPRSSRESGG
jgi:hypothetical protein